MPDAPVPPQNLEAEEAVLGAMLLTPGAIDKVAEEVSARDFYRESHAAIFQVCLDLRGLGQPVDAITVADELEQRDLLARIGKPRLHELAALVPATANAAHYARIVREAATHRALIQGGMEMARLGWERPDPTPILVERAQEIAFDLARERSRSEIPAVGESMRETYDRLVSLYESGRDVIGVPSGLHSLDVMTSGFHPGNLIVLAARPSMGKSAMAVGFAAHVALRVERPVALFTLEMSRQEVNHRLIALEAGVDLHRLRTGRLRPEDWSRTGETLARLERAPLYVDDDGSMTILEIRARARRLQTKHPDLALVIIDYLQLMTGEGDSREQVIARISRHLKVLARELNVPIIALSQLSRGVESRHDKRPILSDLRESGAIEQDADLVLFVYRDEYYNPEDPEVAGLAEVLIAKHRNGPTGMVKATFVKRTARFSEPPLPGTGGSE